MKKYINYKMFLTIFIYILFMELIFSFLTYKNITIYIILFSLIYSLLIYFLYNLFNNKKILYFIYTLILILFLNNYIYYINYSMFITFDVFIKSFKVLYLISNYSLYKKQRIFLLYTSLGNLSFLENPLIKRSLTKKKNHNFCIKITVLIWRRHPDLNWGIKLLQSSALPLGYGAELLILKTKDAICVLCLLWSGRRDSNSRRSPWQGDALPLSHSRIA